MKHSVIILALIVVTAIAASCAAPTVDADGASQTQAPMNVVFIILDDMNDYIGYMGGHPQTQTPNIDALASQSVVFSNAHANVPICAPERSSMLTGIYAHNSRNYGFAKWFQNPVLKNSRTIMEYLRDNGYDALGVGKVMHHLKRDEWTTFGPGPDYGPVWFDGEKKTAHPSVPKPFYDIGPIDGSYAPMTPEFVERDGDHYVGWYKGGWTNAKPLRYRSDDDRDRLPDEISADWAVSQLESRAAKDDSKPFFLAVGLIKPHTPLHVPNKYFDRFPLDDVQLPGILENDIADTYYHKLYSRDAKGPRYYRTLGESYADVEDGLKAFTQAYLAATNFVDEQVGKIVDAVDRSEFRDNTIIVFTSDHGYTLGEKEYVFKSAMWESSTRVPFLIRFPGGEQKILTAPVAHIDFYPTLQDILGLTGDTQKNADGRPLDGTSLRAYIEGDVTAAPKYAVSLAGGRGDSKEPVDQTYSLRSENWRYTLYYSGDEELYDHSKDPNEYKNLADDSRYSNIMAAMRRDLLALLEQK